MRDNGATREVQQQKCRNDDNDANDGLVESNRLTTEEQGQQVNKIRDNNNNKVHSNGNSAYDACMIHVRTHLEKIRT